MNPSCGTCAAVSAASKSGHPEVMRVSSSPYCARRGALILAAVVTSAEQIRVHPFWRRTLWPGDLLLLGKDRLKHRLLNVRFQCATRGIDERVGASILQLRVFFLHVVLGAVIAELHVAGQPAH